MNFLSQIKDENYKVEMFQIIDKISPETSDYDMFVIMF